MVEKTVYENDIIQWVEQQVLLIKEKRYTEVDWVNLLEEIEDLSKRERDRFLSSIRLIIQHLLKCEYQPERRSRLWQITIKRERNNLKRYLRDTPSLKRYWDDLPKVYLDVRGLMLLMRVTLTIVSSCFSFYLTPVIAQSHSLTNLDSIIDSCPIDTDSDRETALRDRFFVKNIEILGNTVLESEIQEIVSLFTNRELTFAELICLRTAITQLYVQNGYITSGAFLPNNQDISNGMVQIQVVEGEVENIEINGLKRLRSTYIRSRLQRYTQQPLNQQQLQEGLELLQLNPLLSKINAELITGTSPDKSILVVNVKESPAFHLGIGVDNYRPPNIGSDELTFALSHDNVLGFGDRFAGEYSLTEGLNLYNVSYNFPVNSLDGTVGFQYWNTDSVIVEPIFDTLDIRNQTETFSFQYYQPVYRTPETEVALGLNFDLRRNRSQLEDVSFCFSLPCNEGKTNLSVLRFSQEWLNRGTSNVLTVRSQFSFGLDAFDATENNIEPDSQFFSWLGQFQYVERFNNNWLLLARFTSQLTPDTLPIIEQFSLGGIDSVRGYGQNTVVTDNAVLASVEVRIPLTYNPSVLQLTPFIEGGTGWNNTLPDPETSSLVGVGLGLRWLPIEDLIIRLHYGIPLISLENRGDSLQSQGFYFSVHYQPF